MSGNLGLVELLFVLVGVMGWGAYELWVLRRPKNPGPKRSDETDR